MVEESTSYGLQTDVSFSEVCEDAEVWSFIEADADQDLPKIRHGGGSD